MENLYLFITMLVFLMIVCLYPSIVTIMAIAKEYKGDKGNFSLHITKTNKEGVLEYFYQEFDGKIIQYSKKDALQQKKLLENLFIKVDVVNFEDNLDSK